MAGVAGRQRNQRARIGPRAIQACQACAASKTRCDNDRYCRRCRKKNIPCVRHILAPVSSAPAHLTHDTASPDADINATDGRARAYSASISVVEKGVTGPTMVSENGEENAANTPQATMSPQPHSQTEHQTGISDEVWRTISHPEWDLNFVQHHFNFGGDDDLGQPNPLSPIPDIFGFDETTLMSSLSPRTQLSISPVVDDEKSVVVMDAFRKATGRWVPAAVGNFQADEEKNLSATNGADITIDASSRWGSQMMPVDFPLVARDRLLALMVSSCHSIDVLRVAATFPSCESLRRLVISFLTWHMNQDDTWIHIPTFSVAETRVELLASMVAAGAVRSSSRAVQKFGLAVHELLQLQLRDMAQREPILTRELQYLQAYALEVQTGLWSGNKRKMEIASGSVSNVANMLRAGGRFRRSHYSPKLPSPEDCGLVLESKWREWLEQEATIRLVYHLNIHGSQDSLLTAAPSPLAPAELVLPLPQGRSLWFAQNATAWKEAALALQMNENAPHVSLVDCFADLSQLRHMPPIYDMNSARLTVLHGIVCMVQSFRHLQIASAARITEGEYFNSRESILPDESQHNRLLKVFNSLHQSFRLSESSTDMPLSILLVFELLLLHFNCSITQMEILAGKEGFEEAQASFSVLRQWAQTREARQAVWQSGQILKLVKALPADTMNDFHCVALYHASLCLWTFGNITNSKLGVPLAAAPQPPPQQFTVENIVLDGEESLKVQRWIAFNRGLPVIASSSMFEPEAVAAEVISTESPELVMQTCIQAIKSKYPSRKLLPPCTERLCHLMQALSATWRKEPNNEAHGTITVRS